MSYAFLGALQPRNLLACGTAAEQAGEEIVRTCETYQLLVIRTQSLPGDGVGCETLRHHPLT